MVMSVSLRPTQRSPEAARRAFAGVPRCLVLALDVAQQTVATRVDSQRHEPGAHRNGGSSGRGVPRGDGSAGGDTHGVGHGRGARPHPRDGIAFCRHGALRLWWGARKMRTEESGSRGATAPAVCGATTIKMLLLAVVVVVAARWSTCLRSSRTRMRPSSTLRPAPPSTTLAPSPSCRGAYRQCVGRRSPMAAPHPPPSPLHC